MTTVRRVFVVQLAVFLTGALLLCWVATPLYFDEISSLESVSWPLLWVPALALSALGGTIAGLCLQRRWPWWVAAAGLVLVGVPAIGPPMFFVTDWPGSTVSETNFTDLVAASHGWMLYVTLSTGLALAVGGRAAGGAQEDADGS
jgi:hypothetical protein